MFVDTICSKSNLPNGTFALEHSISLVEAFALKVDLLKKKAIDLLKLHLILVRKLLELHPKAIDLSLKFGLILVDRLPESLENVKLIAVDKGYY